MNSITFETKCYEKDWEIVCNPDHLQSRIEECNYKFDSKILYLNNFEDYSKPIKAAEQLVSLGVIDEFYIVKDYMDRAFRALDITVESFKGNYYYSVSELVSIYLNKTEFLLHFSSDSRMLYTNNYWINESCIILQQNPQVYSTSPLWVSNYADSYTEALSESVGQTDRWFLDHGFSDQCYLIQVDKFRQPIYNEHNPASARFPDYAGELFEKRVYSFYQNHKYLRAVNKESCFKHENF